MAAFEAGRKPATIAPVFRLLRAQEDGVPSTRRKARVKVTPDGLPVHSFCTLIDDLAGAVVNVVRLSGAGKERTTVVLQRIRLQNRTFELLEVTPVLPGPRRGFPDGDAFAERRSRKLRPANRQHSRAASRAARTSRRAPGRHGDSLHKAPREARLSAFAAATGIRENEDHRMLNPCHATKTGRLEEAPPFFKKRLAISVEENTRPSIRAGSDFDPLAGTASTSNAWPTGQ